MAAFIGTSTAKMNFMPKLSGTFCTHVREPWQKPRPELCDPNVQFGRYVVDAYLSREHLDDLDGSCPLIGLSSDVGRSSQTVKAAYREVVESMIRLFEANLSAIRVIISID